MGYQVFPEPVASGTSLPVGASSKVVDGVARKGGFTYTSSTVTSGPKMAYAVNGTGGKFVVSGSNKTEIINDGEYSVINFTTSQSSVVMTDVYNADYIINDLMGPDYPTRIGVYAGNQMVYRNGIFFLLTQMGSNTWTVVITTNFVNWSTRTRLGTQAINAFNMGGVVYNSTRGMYLAFPGGDNVIGLSTDGVNWTTTGSPGALTTINLIYTMRGWFVGFVNNTNVTWISTNGTTWATSTTSALPNVAGPSRALAFNSDRTIGIGTISGNNQSIAMTTNGIAWSTREIISATTGNYSSSVFCNGLFMVVGTDPFFWPTVALSSNGTTWTLKRISQTTSGTTNYPYIAAANDKAAYIAFGTGRSVPGSSMIMSIDGVNWTTATNLQSIPEGAGVFTGDRVITLTYNSQSGLDGMPQLLQFGKETYYSLYNMSDTYIN